MIYFAVLCKYTCCLGTAIEFLFRHSRIARGLLTGYTVRRFVDFPRIRANIRDTDFPLYDFDSSIRFRYYGRAFSVRVA